MYSIGDAVDDTLKSFQHSEDDLKKYSMTLLNISLTVTLWRGKALYTRETDLINVYRRREPADNYIANYFLWFSWAMQLQKFINAMIRDCIVVGIGDRNLSKRLLLEANLTLEKAITTVHQSASVKKQQSNLRQDTSRITTETLISAVGKCYVQRPQNTSDKSSTQALKSFPWNLQVHSAHCQDVADHPHMTAQNVHVRILYYATAIQNFMWSL